MIDLHTVFDQRGTSSRILDIESKKLLTSDVLEVVKPIAGLNHNGFAHEEELLFKTRSLTIYIHKIKKDGLNPPFPYHNNFNEQGFFLTDLKRKSNVKA